MSNSRYRNKQKNRKPKVFSKVGPAFTYISTCHSAPATKKPCALGQGEADDKGYYSASLGTWNCSVCRQKCKVSRTRRKDADATEATETSAQQRSSTSLVAA